MNERPWRELKSPAAVERLREYANSLLADCFDFAETVGRDFDQETDGISFKAVGDLGRHDRLHIGFGNSEAMIFFKRPLSVPKRAYRVLIGRSRFDEITPDNILKVRWRRGNGKVFFKYAAGVGVPKIERGGQ
jgi:hypothetical protein